MEVSVTHVDRILEMLSEKTKQPLDLAGFGEMSSRIGDKISKKYLYELYRDNEKSKARRESVIDRNVTKLDAIAGFLVKKSFRLLIEEFENPVNEILASCVGTYYNYVRRNSESTAVFRSPVRIYQDQHKFLFELQGPSSLYKGELRLKEGCLFVVMEAGNGKMIHHVYKIGKRNSPSVLQGIFSGVSTTFDLIGGRTVLVRSKEKFESLACMELSSQQLKKSTVHSEPALANYFKERERNNLSISGSGMTFTLEDLKAG